MSDLSPQTRKLIDMARDGDRLPPGRRALLESRFFARVAGGAVIGLAAREAFAKSAGLFGPVTKGIAGLAIISSIGAGGYFAVRATRYDLASSLRNTPAERSRATGTPVEFTAPATQAIVAAPQPVAAAPSRPSRSTEAEPSRRASNSMNVAEPRESIGRRAPAASRASTSRAAPSVAAAAPAQTAAPAAAPPATPEQPTPAPAAEETAQIRVPNTLADETRLLWEADQALRSGNTSRAVSLLDEHASRYPDGSLSPERGAERVVALCKLGRIDAPTVRSYLTSHPNLSLSERIQQACSRILSRSK
jgi:RNA polymerase sigma-70 factor (ECF subfamily)